MNQQIKSEKKGQAFLIFLCWLVYTVSYLGRYSYNANILSVMDEYGVDRAAAGLVGTFFFFSYGIGQIVNGIFCKKYEKQKVLTFALLVAAVLNLTVFFGVDFAVIKYLWLINGAVQSVLWSSLISVLGEYLEDGNIKKSVLVMSTCVVSGIALSYGLSSVFTLIGDYKLSFLLGAVSIFLVAIIWFISFGRYKKNTQKYVPKIAAPTIEKESNAKRKAVKGSVIALICVLCVFAVFDNFVKDGLQTWVPDILKSKFDLDNSLSTILTILLPVFGIFGTAVCVFAQKKVKNPILLNALFFGIIAVLIAVLMLVLDSSLLILSVILLAVIYLFATGINNVLTSVAPLYLRNEIDAGFSSGIIDGFCYAGSTISAFGLGLVADNGGWNVVFILILSVSIFAVLIGGIFYFILGRRKSNTNFE